MGIKDFQIFLQKQSDLGLGNKCSYFFETVDTIEDVKVQILTNAHFHTPKRKHLVRDERKKVQLMLNDVLLEDESQTLAALKVPAEAVLTWKLSAPLEA